LEKLSRIEPMLSVSGARFGGWWRISRLFEALATGVCRARGAAIKRWINAFGRCIPAVAMSLLG
jgi:hypothetical protein